MWHVIPGGETLRRWWNHPLANYALLLSTTMLLLVLGIVMVFSASNVVTYAAGSGVGLTVTEKQLMFAVAAWPSRRRRTPAPPPLSPAASRRRRPPGRRRP